MIKRVSVHDVAGKLGISISSVSKALNGNQGVSDALRSIVLSTASAMGYQASATARTLRMGRSRAVGCMVNTITNPLLASVVDAMERHLRDRGYTLFLANSHDSRGREREILAMFEERGMDGAIVSTSFAYPVKDKNPFLTTRLPLVVLERTLDTTGDAVWVDHRQGAYSAANHLIGYGHRRIALFTAGSRLRPARERVKGFRRAIDEANLKFDPSLVTPLGMPSDSGYDEMVRFLEMSSPPTALICIGTRLLAGALRAVSEKGLRVPDNFSVIAIGERTLMEYFSPNMTLLQYDQQLLGASAVEMMISRLDSPDDLPPRRVEIPMQLLPGDSCGPCRVSGAMGKLAGNSMPQSQAASLNRVSISMQT